MVLHIVERSVHDGGGVTVTLKAATGQKALTTYDVYTLEGYQADYLGTLADRMAMAFLTAERIRDIRRIFALTVKEARRHDQAMTGGR